MSFAGARRVVLPVVAAVLAGMPVGAAPPARGANVILAMADDMGWGDPAYNGHPTIKTPNLDAMARAGVRFDRFYAPTVCSPTRGSCLTGRHPFRYGIFSANVGRLPLGEQTVAEALQARGYATGHFGKWHLGTLTNDVKDGRRGGRDPGVFSPPWLHGFTVSFSTEQAVPTWDPMVQQPFETRYWTGPGQFAAENLEGDDSRVLMDRVLPFIRGAAGQDRPFLAVLWFHTPHEPVRAGDAYRKAYADRTPKEQNYYGAITAMDEQVGRLRKELRTLGIEDETMFWFCSDNVPCLLEWPGAVAGSRVVDVPCVTSDFYPTLRDYLGIVGEAPRPLDGISLRPLLEGTLTDWPTPIGFEYGNMAALLDNRYKLVALLRGGDSEPDGDGRPAVAVKAGDGRPAGPAAQASGKGVVRRLLFDIIADPREENDLAARKPGIAGSMAEALEAWRLSCRRSLAEQGD
jgi:arylsulfatase A-like enzyme